MHGLKIVCLLIFLHVVTYKGANSCIAIIKCEKSITICIYSYSYLASYIPIHTVIAIVYNYTVANTNIHISMCFM